MTAELHWIDNHCHIESADFGERSRVAPDTPEQIVSQARAAGVVAMVCAGVDVATSRRSLELAASFPEVWATAGVHPHEADHGIDGLSELLVGDRPGGPVPVAVGECGLDYHYEHSPRAAQREVFSQQIALAHEHQLPLVIHTRDAWDETFAILDAEGMPERTVFHCFTGGPREADRCLERGALLSISGIVTFPSASELRDAVSAAPLESLMVETDAPYLAPVPHRGRPNTPSLVPVIGAAVAQNKDLTIDEVARVTSSNARAFYGLPVHSP